MGTTSEPSPSWQVKVKSRPTSSRRPSRPPSRAGGSRPPSRSGRPPSRPQSAAKAKSLEATEDLGGRRWMMRAETAMSYGRWPTKNGIKPMRLEHDVSYFCGRLQGDSRYTYSSTYSVLYGSQRPPVVLNLRRWDWGGCQEGPVIPSEEVRLEV